MADKMGDEVKAKRLNYLILIIKIEVSGGDEGIRTLETLPGLLP